jgi:hypothetical protein
MQRISLLTLSALSLALGAGCGEDGEDRPGNAGGNINTGGSSGGTGGSAGPTGGTGGTSPGPTGGTGGSGGSGGATAGGCTDANTMTLTAADTLISDFSTPGEEITAVPGMGTIVTFGGGTTPAPTIDTANGNLNITLTTVAEANAFPGLALSFSSCIDAATTANFTGVELTISGSVTGAGCIAGFQIPDSPHTDPANDPAKGSTAGGYSGTLPLTVTDTASTVMVPFTGTGAPPFANNAANPSVDIDPTMLLGVAFSFPAVAANECVIDLTVDDVQFY